MKIVPMGFVRQVLDNSICKAGAGVAAEQLRVVNTARVERVDLYKASSDDVQTGDSYPVLQQMGTDRRSKC